MNRQLSSTTIKLVLEQPDGVVELELIVRRNGRECRIWIRNIEVLSGTPSAIDTAAIREALRLRSWLIHNPSVLTEGRSTSEQGLIP
ncbi:hypothetical protein [Thalassoroseus pseudoceratinae]|uniref:hypothetical protein n=1 Tax=Thalassoroseus pseudoceratinae TaxID=2713176 RepID=UPI0014213746|nr:hypothetical protein [Thalassoroseus pseudoceratinae]